MSVTVVIPTLNEEERIAATVASAFAAGALEVIVVDGGSLDRTARYATGAGARLLLSEPMRARQLNLGADAASHETLIFLHADTHLPANAAQAAENALARGADFGGFRIAFAEAAPKLRIVAAMINLRTRLSRCPWGDQAQFINRDAFFKAGGFLEIPLMEDYELSVRMKRAGRSVVLPLTVTTSGRRFLRKGVVSTTVRNWRTIVRYRMGADINEMARNYRK
jgi:rSAM/selenodomain-associated transferase 2